jgi:hypothetical protein
LLPKSKNIAKPLEGCSKSHFSHIRNQVEKVTLRPLILKSFLDPKSTQHQEKVVPKSLQKSSRFLIRFFIDFGSILDPTGHLKIQDFSLIFGLGVALGPTCRQEGAQSAPRQLWRSIFQEFGTILGSILEEFSKISEQMFNITLTSMSYSMLLLPLNSRFQLATRFF